MAHNNIDELKGWFRTIWFPFINMVPNNIRGVFGDEVVNKYVKKNPVDNYGKTHVKMVRLEVMAKSEGNGLKND